MKQTEANSIKVEGGEVSRGKGKAHEAEGAKIEAKQKPIRFKDAVGRKFSFPFHLCNTWAVSVTTSFFSASFLAN